MKKHYNMIQYTNNFLKIYYDVCCKQHCRQVTKATLGLMLANQPLGIFLDKGGL